MKIVEKIKVDCNYALVMDNWYSPEEYDKALEECKFMTPYLLEPEKSGTAKDKEGNPLKNNRAAFLSDVFSQFNTSFIGKSSINLYHSNILEKLASEDNIYSYLFDCNAHDCLVSYYEEAAYYEAHSDSATITMLTWLYDIPKSFEGGDLILINKDNTTAGVIECVPNRAVIFPSYMKHQVTEVKMKEVTDKNKGRYTISQFSMIGAVR